MMAMNLHAFVERYVSILVHFIEERMGMGLGVKDELKGLQEKLESVRGLLDDAESKQLQDPAISTWVAKLKDIMYDADDIMDLCRIKGEKRWRSFDDQASTSMASYWGVSHLFSKLPSRSDLKSAHEIACRIKTLNERLKEVTEDKIVIPRLERSNRNIHVGGVDLGQTSPLVEFDVVGRDIEYATNGLVEMLVTKDKQKCCTFAIVGMGGIGKTTLAQKIFNDPRIEGNFQPRIWVCVSQIFSEIELLKQMIRQAGESHGEASTKVELLPILMKAVSGKRLFLVLDDVWQANVWVDLLRNPIQSGAAIGRILVTTRDENIVRLMGALHTHKVKELPEDSGWEFLCKKVFASGEEAEMEMLRDIGIQIIRKCRGLPLAIKTIAGLLATKDKNKNEWRKVLRSDAWSMSNLPEELRGALYLSYEGLPSELKQCFLYFALFPEDYCFFGRDLVRFWVAEGFVKSQEGSSMEEIAEQYYRELMRRNMLEPNLSGKKCRIHDLLRSLAISLSGDESFHGDVDGLKPAPVSKLRRLSIAKEGEMATVPVSVIKQDSLRTLILLRSPSSFDNDSLGRLTHLRVLYLNGTCIKSIPDSIGKLVHLRLLDLDHTSISTLPESICCLTNLQILKLASCKCLRTLPQGITGLFNLTCLGVAGTPLNFLPKGIGNLEQLDQLEGFVVGDDGNGSQEAQGCNLEELNSLSRLRYLEIYRLERALNEAPILDNKTNLKKLELCCTPQNQKVDQRPYTRTEINQIEEVFESLTPSRCLEDLCVTDFFGRRYPGWMMSSSSENSLPNLKILVLLNNESCKELPSLGQLPQLSLLLIKGASAIVSVGPEFLYSGVRQGSYTEMPTIFPKLKAVRFLDMPNWEEWQMSGQAASQSPLLLPRLKMLDLINCPMLRALPQGLQQATMMQSLKIEGAHNLRRVEDFPFLSYSLDMFDNRCLETVSNLPAIKTLRIHNCPALRYVENLDALQRLILTDEAMDSLPQWIFGLLQERQRLNQDSLELILDCNVSLLERCLRGRPDWLFIQQFSRVSAHADTNTGKAYLYYTKVPFCYQTNL